MERSINKTLYITELAVLIAIILLMAFTPIGYIKTAGLSITLIGIPVTIGAITLGPVAGLILGTVFGITSFINCFTDAFGAVLLSINPFLTVLVTIPTRMLMGLCVGLIYRALLKSKIKKAALPIASVLGPVLNTFFFMTTLVLCFYHTDYIQGFVKALGAKNPIIFVFMFIGVNAVVEIVVNFIAATAISKALLVVLRNQYLEPVKAKEK